MPSNYTEHYQLNLWAAEDKVQRVDFNADNEKIDVAIKAVDAKASAKAEQSALNAEIKARADGDSAINSKINTINTALAAKGNCRIATGTYVGNGKCGKDNPISLELGFAPKLVIAHSVGGAQIECATTGDQQRTILLLTRPAGRFYAHAGRQIVYLNWGDQGISWYCETGADFQMNASGATYLYIAIG